jgi:glycosyltransferase involved in cell wall biosynthesis
MLIQGIKQKNKLPMPKNILFIVRSNSKIKGGGDLSLMSHFERLVAELNLKVSVANDPFIDLHGFSAIFSVNLDRPVESYILAKRCKKHGIPLYLYTLHHPFEGVELYLKEIEFKGVRGVVSYIVKNSFLQYESILSIIRALIGRQFKFFLYPKAFISSYAARYLIRNTHLVITGEKEKYFIEKDFKEKVSKYSYIPHAFSFKAGVNPVSSKKINRVLCAGRIEPRKNQINVLEVAKQLPEYQFIFIGGVNPSAQSYYREFRSKAAALQNVTIQDSVSIHELRNLLSSAEFFISLSFFEVVSLTEVEAYLANCKMIICKYSYLSNFIDFNRNDIQFVSPTDISEVVKAIKKLSKEVVRSKVRINSICNGKAKNMQEENIQFKFKKMLSGLL